MTERELLAYYHDCVPRGPQQRQTSARAVDLPKDKGDLQCHGQVGAVFCAFL
jgi:hypothetical protein